MNIIEYFEQVRIINMESRKDRRHETESEFIRHGFRINTDKIAFFNAITPVEPQGFQTPGVRGCFLSHMKILEDAASAKADNILILEDDIQFSKYIDEYGALAIELLGDIDWDIAYFGHALGNTPGDVTWKKINEPMLLAHFYAVNGKALNRLTHFLKLILERPPGHPEGGPMHYDGALNTFMRKNNDIKAFYFSRNLGYQRPSKTDLHKHSIFDRNILLKPMIIAYRKVKRLHLRIIR